MPWMLIAKGGSLPAPNSVVSELTTKPPPAAQAPVPPSVQAQAPRFDAWILHGDLSTALYQAGVCSRLCAQLQSPTALYCSGYATINAVLTASGGSHAIDAGWEKLRSNRLLFDAGLRGLPFLTSFAGSSGRIENLLNQEFAKPCATETRVNVFARIGNGFQPMIKETGGELGRSVAAQTLRDTAQDESVWVASVREALALGARKILLVGIPSSRRDPIPPEAAKAVLAAGGELSAVPFRTHEKPRAIDYIWVGSGVPERLIRDGAGAADRWLGSLAIAGGDTVIRPNGS